MLRPFWRHQSPLLLLQSHLPIPTGCSLTMPTRSLTHSMRTVPALIHCSYLQASRFASHLRILGIKMLSGTLPGWR